MDGIRGWIEAEGTGHWFFVAFPVILLCLFIWFKGRRVCFLIPSLIISIVIINPVFYKYWDEFGLYAYWRILWVIPVIPVVAGLVPSISEKIRKTWMKSIVVAAGVGAVVVSGTFLYNGAGGSFTVAANASKEPDYVVQIADRLLELDENPRVIAQDPIGVYLRQYTGDIDTLYGRDIEGYIYSPSDEVREIYDRLINEDMSIIAQYMLDESYTYLIINKEINKHFELLQNIQNYSIYKAKGMPKVIKKRNDLGQVIEISMLDKQGNLVNGEDGYATAHFEYDSYNNIIMEWFTDKQNNPCIQKAGHVIVAQTWNDNVLISREYLDISGEHMERNDGYSCVKWTKDNQGIISTHFFDINGEEVSLYGKNLACVLKTKTDGWSEWITPEIDCERYYQIGEVILGEKVVDDFYTCSFDVEFQDVESVKGKRFRFWSLGAVDGKWVVPNIWSNGIIDLDIAPEDGIYHCSYTTTITEKMISASTFELGFRCDNWRKGSFRIKNVKIEKGSTETNWDPGP